ncbi:MAG: cupin domain-containing protein [Mycobacterium sp.]|nr:cupin domain-containing protein [Mycobacterium sp.]
MRPPGKCQALSVKPNTIFHGCGHRIEHVPVPAHQVAGGHPRTGTGTLGRFAGLEVGVWEMTPGVMRDVEADEVFVVIAGAATVEFADGAAPLHLSPGDVVRLAAGTETVWTVTETLRKVYLV